MVKRQEGFTLMEMIISVGALALISGFILQMFIVSSNVNQKAHDTDIASTIVVQAIETIKSRNAVDDYILDDFYQESVAENEGDQLRIIKCYDKDWQPLETSWFDDDERVRYKLTVTIQKEMPMTEEVWLQFSQEEEIMGSTGMFCVIHAEMSDEKAEVDKQLLADVDASKYFDSWVMQ